MAEGPESISPSLAVYMAAEVVVAVASVLGNALVCWAVRLNRALRDTTFCFVVSLALADVAVGSLVIPVAITISAGPRTDFHSCLLLSCAMLVLTQSSILALLAIAVDRYLHVRIPVSYKRVVTQKRAGAAVILCWTISIIVGVIPMFGWNNYNQVIHNEVNSSLKSNIIVCHFETVISMDYMVYFNFFGWVLPPLVLILVIYVEIFHLIRKHLNQKALSVNTTDPSRYFGKELKLAKSLALVLFLFAICWLPLHIINCITFFCPSCKIPVIIMYIAIFLTHGNSAVNPIVYAFRITKFRLTFLQIWSQYIRCDKNHNHNSNNLSKGELRANREQKTTL
ncbi:adenosine receptor A1 [Callorhinchus milii]|uniref:Adenosine receptor A1 n=1 Tax=Callorhinchus milii TaxID=7868 RepID=A0A4W3GAX9_CALMI|nr:adenosine receptor A1 [Callorhinchus milii]|eukprot:gi/632953315/ref/XP_007892351.1/ PREDICTED: adenosine receptor A1 [Callorhinchus milii]